jgi:threonine dehydrogenase-like Zn-dependent dehydrogenase
MTQSRAEQTDQIQEKMLAVPLPAREALVKVDAVGICASYLKCYHGAAKFWADANRPAWRRRT